MSELDLAKEKIAYLKLWLGVMIAGELSLMGWLLTNFRSAHWLLIVSGILILFTIGFGGYVIHIRIEAKIAGLKEL